MDTSLNAYRDEMLHTVPDLAESGRVRPVVGGTYAFADAAAAHAAIEALKPIGKVVLVP